MKIQNLLITLFILLGLTSCSSDDNWSDSDTTLPTKNSNITYILNEGGFGSSNSTLTYFNNETDELINDYYQQVNPSLGGLGDTGNDLQIYNSKMYAVMNASNLIEVMDSKTAVHLGSITIPNARNIAFNKGYAYVSSYASATYGNDAALGIVFKIDTNTLQIVDEVNVGRQPDGLAITNNKLYVANSGGYTTSGNYETTVSVIDLNSFQVTKTIEVAPNLSKVKVDKNNRVWVTSRGIYGSIASSISVIDPNTDKVIKKLDISVSDFDFYGNSMYYLGSSNTYGALDINTFSLTSSSFINESVKSQILYPYGIGINQKTGDIFIADAMNFIVSGKVYCFNINGDLKWVNTTGIIPAHFAFLY